MPIDPFDGLRVSGRKVWNDGHGVLATIVQSDPIQTIIDAANKWHALEQKGTPTAITAARVRPEFSVDPGDYE